MTTKKKAAKATRAPKSVSPDTQEALRITLKLMTKEQTEDLYAAVQCDDLVYALTEGISGERHPELERIAKALRDAVDEAQEYLDDNCRFHKIGYPYDDSED